MPRKKLTHTASPSAHFRAAHVPTSHQVLYTFEPQLKRRFTIQLVTLDVLQMLLSLCKTTRQKPLLPALLGVCVFARQAVVCWEQ